MIHKRNSIYPVQTIYVKSKESTRVPYKPYIKNINIPFMVNLYIVKCKVYIFNKENKRIFIL
jgi:hypothetical protein